VNNKIYIARIYIAAFTQDSYRRGPYNTVHTNNTKHLALGSSSNLAIFDIRRRK
jgi:hypothetical protein